MMLMDMSDIIELVEELNNTLATQEHPIRATDSSFYVATDGYDMYVSFDDIHVFDDNVSWTDDEDSLPPDLLLLTVMRRQLYEHMDAIEAGVNVIERKIQELERKRNQ